MRSVVLAAITAYQRYVSPYKGFSCAYRRHTGRSSCSKLGYRAVRRLGVVTGLAVLRRRLDRCREAHQRHSLSRRRPHRSERGDCDCALDLPCEFGGDLPRGRFWSWLGDFASCCDCGSCDWPRRKRTADEDERRRYLPPRRGGDV